MRTLLGLAALAGASFSLGGCEGPDRASDVMRTWSAGGTRPESVIEPRRISPSPRTIRLDAPRLRIGGSNAAEDFTFGRVKGGVIDSLDRLWLADDMASQIVRVGPEGEASLVGRRGRGPGELIQASIVGWHEGNVIVFDGEQYRLVLVDVATDSFTTIRLEPPRWNGSPRFMVGLGPAGEYVFIPYTSGSRPIGESYDPDRPRWLSQTPVRLVVEGDADSAIVLFSEPFADLYFDGDRYGRDPFSNAWVAGVYRDTVALAGALGGDVLVSDLSGSHRVGLNVGESPGTVVSDSLAGRVRRYLAELPERRRRRFAPVEAFEQRGYPERMAFFDRLIVSSDGSLWVRRKEDTFGRDEVRWEVITLTGDRLGTALLDAGETVVAAGPKSVATLAFDRYEAAVIRVYENPFPRATR